MTDRYRRAFRYRVSGIAYEIAWRVLFVVSLPLRPVARLIVWGYGKMADRR